jgi:hypothetical protein
MTPGDENLLVTGMENGDEDVSQWLMEVHKMTTNTKCPMYHALNVEGDDDFDFPIDRWLLSTRKAFVEDVDDEGRTELVYMIENRRWPQATFLVDVGNATIDVSCLWAEINWSKLAKDESYEVQLFLRALLPRVDFPTEVYVILNNTSIRGRVRDGRSKFVHKEMVEKGMIVRK